MDKYKILFLYDRQEVFTTMKIQVVVLRAVTPCSDVVGYQCFGGPCSASLKMEVPWPSKRWYHYTAWQPRRPRLVFVNVLR